MTALVPGRLDAVTKQNASCGAGALFGKHRFIGSGREAARFPFCSRFSNTADDRQPIRQNSCLAAAVLHFSADITHPFVFDLSASPSNPLPSAHRQ